MAENKSENGGEFSPQPQFEIPGSPEQKEQGREKQAERAIEQRPASENTVTKQAPQFPQQTPSQQPDPQAQTQTPAKDAFSHSAGLSAADVELIEKVWVEKAKSIVAQTHDDPYKQKNEMSKYKADYIKKRFNKTIPLDDTSKS
jgi:hypothetical protein